MRMYDVIAKKRDGETLTYEELEFFIKGYTKGDIPDYQASAFLMAAYIKGMNSEETVSLTRLMAESGNILDLSGIKGIKADKHSTGGVGDKTTLILAPLVASCGLPVVKMSGRGLGYTGGTIDKLESIPGFRTSLDENEIIENVKKIGVCISSQTADLAPADRKLYALRDVTATVDSMPLIASSVMSKKIAAGGDNILLDVKTGRGAFMGSIDESIQLARLMVETGIGADRKTAAYITDMDTPLGNSIGNAVEVVEALETLKGNGPRDLQMLVVELASRMLEMAGMGDMDECREKVRESLLNRKALDNFSAMIKLQGGNPDVINDYGIMGKAEMKLEICSEEEGYVNEARADMIGRASVVLGAGREEKESSIDNTAGIVLKYKPPMKVAKGGVLATVFANDEARLKEAADIIKKSYVVSKRRPSSRPVILAYVDSENVRRYAD